MTFTAYRRTPEELRKPFECKDSSVSQAGLELVSLEIVPVLCRHHQKWIKERGDAHQHAKEFVASIRTWSTSLFMAGRKHRKLNSDKSDRFNQLFKHSQPQSHVILTAHSLSKCQTLWETLALEIWLPGM